MPENNHHPKQEDIAVLAQQYWEEDGQPEGKAEEHWSRAEHQLRQEQQQATDEGQT